MANHDSTASRSAAALALAIAAVLPTRTFAQSVDDIIGVTKLRALDPTLTGAGVTVGQAEAPFGTGADPFEVSPSAVGQPASLFTYTDINGNVSTTFNSAEESTHADTVGSFFYGATGAAPGVAHVDNYSSQYFFNSIVFYGEPIPDAIVNQSFTFDVNPNPVTELVNQESSDTTYDNYVAEYGTIFVSGVGNSGEPTAPATAYNGIAVGVDDGSSAVGPTQDGRDKPDITAPGDYSSFSTALVSGAAAILDQAGSRGDGGTSPAVEKAAVDPRTIKALLLNGADKQAVTFNRTPTSPLDPANGAGLLNVYSSYEQLAGGDHPASSQSTTPALGGSHAPDVSSPAINSVSGWSFASISSGLLNDSYANYIFQPPAGVSDYTFTATLAWERQYNNNPAVPLGINNLYLYLYNTTTGSLVDSSISTLNNVQDVYDTNLIPGDRYDLEVFKPGGIPGVTPGVVSSSETYALAYNFTANQSVWTLSGGGSAAQALNWAGPLPDVATDTASFTTAINTASTITFPSNWVVGNINFDNTTASYTLASANGGPLVLDNGGVSATATLTDSGGSHAISAPIQLNSNLLATIAQPNNTLSITGNITDNPTGAGAGLTVSGPGTLSLSGVNTFRQGVMVESGALTIAVPNALPAGSALGNNGSIVITAGSSAAPVLSGQIVGWGHLSVGAGAPAYLRIAPGSGQLSQAALTIGSGSTLDLTNNQLLLTYGLPTADPVFTIASLLQTGYNHGQWNGPGIISTSAAAQPTVFALGYADGNMDHGTPAAANELVIAYTIAGDANLDGTVGFSDLVTVAENFGKSGEDWAGGNFIYAPNGTVGFADLALVAENFGKVAYDPQRQSFSLSPTSAFAPEPAVWPLAVSGVLALRRRAKKTGDARSSASPGVRGGKEVC